MIRVIKDYRYKFTSIFNDKTGEYIRGIDRSDDPFMAVYPHLIDIGIMSTCVHGKTGLCMKAGIKCYQDGLNKGGPDMTLEDYKSIMEQSKGRLFEVALGGRGDPDMHKNFEDILRVSRESGIVPNFTTSGLGMTPEKAKICKEYCGAVAVSMYSRLRDIVPDLAARKVHNVDKLKVYRSEDDIPVKFTFGNFDDDCIWDTSEYKIEGMSYSIDELCNMYYSEAPQDYEFYRVYNEKNSTFENGVENYTIKAINMLLDAGVKTNIHYVLSNTTIDEALVRMKYNGFPKGINAVIFLLHKPVGLGDESDVLEINDPRVKELFELVNIDGYPFKIGFDSCSIPGVLKWSTHIDTRSIDTCEGSRFSMYISADMCALPCSFDNQKMKYAVHLGEGVTIQDAWDSNEFENFRSSLRNSCPNCSKRELCMGGCPLERSIVLCEDSEKKFVDF